MSTPDDPARTLPEHDASDQPRAAADPSVETRDDLEPQNSDETLSVADAYATHPTPHVHAGHAPPSQTFGDYELLGMIARGGMGIVYKARQRNLNRIVALKMILAGQLAHEDEIARFRAEAEAAAGLDHPGIVPIYEVGQIGGQHFFSMGFVDGQSLAKRVNESPLASRDAAQMLLSIADAVQYAHSHGIIHRDLKPGNVLVRDGQRGTGEGSTAVASHTAHGSTPSNPQASDASSNVRPMITDFGLAKRLESDSSLTASGQVLGTPSYMPPEQARGLTQQVDVRADVYAMGAILYSMLTGRAPFHGATMVETIRHVCELDPVPPRQINPEISRDLETICLKCLEKDAARRYQTAGELIEDLSAFVDGRPVKSRPVGTFGRLSRWARRKPVVASLISAVLLVSIIGVSGVVWKWRESNANFLQSQKYLGDARRNLKDAVEAQRLADEQRQHADEQRKQAEDSAALAVKTLTRFLTIVPNHELLDQPGMEPLKKKLRMLGRDSYLQMAEARPDDWAVKHGLSQSHFFLAITLEDMGEYQDAVKEYQAAAELFELLAKASPDSPAAKRNVAACYGNLANVQIMLGQSEEGAATYRRICEMQQAIADDHPDDSRTLADLAMTYMNLALIELEAGQFDESMVTVTKAHELTTTLLQDHPDDLNLQRSMAKADSTIGRLHWENEQFEDALVAYEKSADTYRMLLTSAAEKPQMHAELSQVLNDAGTINADLDRNDEAFDLLEASVKHATIATESAPRVHSFHENYLLKMRHRGVFRRNIGEFQGAIEDLLTTRKRAPNNGSWLFTTACDLDSISLTIQENVDKLPEEIVSRVEEIDRQTIDWLRESMEQGYDDVTSYETAPPLRSVRDRPEFAELLKQIKSE